MERSPRSDPDHVCSMCLKSVESVVALKSLGKSCHSLAPILDTDR